jgi:hypothetical protein
VLKPWSFSYGLASGSVRVTCDAGGGEVELKAGPNQAYGLASGRSFGLLGPASGMLKMELLRRTLLKTRGGGSLVRAFHAKDRRLAELSRTIPDGRTKS